jgi:hypothetical protein
MGRVRAALASLTAGQRWTASLALALAAAILVFGTPTGAAPLAAAPTAASPDTSVAGVAAAPVPPPTLPVPALFTDDTPPFLEPALTPPLPAPTPPPSEPAPAPPAAPGPLCDPPDPVALTGLDPIDAILCALVAAVSAP